MHTGSSATMAVLTLPDRYTSYIVTFYNQQFYPIPIINGLRPLYSRLGSWVLGPTRLNTYMMLGVAAAKP